MVNIVTASMIKTFKAEYHGILNTPVAYIILSFIKLFRLVGLFMHSLHLRNLNDMKMLYFIVFNIL